MMNKDKDSGLKCAQTHLCKEEVNGLIQGSLGSRPHENFSESLCRSCQPKASVTVAGSAPRMAMEDPNYPSPRIV